MDIRHKKIIYAFNNFYLNFLTDVKGYNEDLRKVVKKNFKVFDKNEKAYFERIKASIVASKDNIELLPGTFQNEILETIDAGEKNTIATYVYIFKIMALIYDYDETDDGILEKVVSIIKNIKDKKDIKDDLKEILDDDLSSLLEELSETMSLENIPDTSNPKIEETLNIFENSKIGNLAKEISDEIDIGSLNINGPEDLLNFENLTGSNNVLGNIVSKVGTKIQTKIANGEINESELVSEAMGLIGMLNGGGGGGAGGIASMLNNPMFKDILGSMGGMPGMGGGAGGVRTKVGVDQNKVKNMETRERLRRKLEKKKNTQKNV
jgi:hypothetical protein